ncbi:hypothetical protein [Vreelandella janggokensis]|uniref:Integral membrane protein n=1 Tax=Vreelandella janggokensis TaxID=370767 RepID=A0ABT4IZC3_9GAMM|nr:hypothetical protein [Halomonas janggokensis]MCZ0928508.1 hypothetical protein [Halomonas janggokensis]
MADSPVHRVPRWLKLAFSLWVLIWAPSYAVLLGPQNFFWLCNVANFLLLVALWTEHRTLMSMQWLAVALVGSLWTFDVATAAFTGVHPIGGTEYMFNPEHPPMTRAMSLYHVVLPLVAGIGVAKLGYARRALLWQTLLTWVVVPLSYLLTDAERNINWVHGPFGQPQDSLDPLLYLLLLALIWPVAVYLPLHLVMVGGQRWRNRS